LVSTFYEIDFYTLLSTCNFFVQISRPTFYVVTLQAYAMHRSICTASILPVYYDLINLPHSHVLLSIWPQWRCLYFLLLLTQVYFWTIFYFTESTTRKPASADRTARAANFRRDL